MKPPIEERTLTAEQLECLASPLRNEIVAALREHGPSSVNELATFLGLSPKGLYHHVHHLLKAELIVVEGTRAAGRRQESIYATPRAKWILRSDSEQDGYQEQMIRSVSAMLRVLDREHAAAVRATRDQSGSRRLFNVRRLVMRLEPDKLDVLMEKLDEIEAFLHENQTPDRGERISYFVSVLPLVRRQEPGEDEEMAPQSP